MGAYYSFADRALSRNVLTIRELPSTIGELFQLSGTHELLFDRFIDQATGMLVRPRNCEWPGLFVRLGTGVK
jgi:hypothetical protein